MNFGACEKIRSELVNPNDGNIIRFGGNGRIDCTPGILTNDPGCFGTSEGEIYFKEEDCVFAGSANTLPICKKEDSAKAGKGITKIEYVDKSEK